MALTPILTGGCSAPVAGPSARILCRGRVLQLKDWHCSTSRTLCRVVVRLLVLLVFSLPVVRAANIPLLPTTPGGLALAVANSSPGDTIVLSPGRYVGPNNRNLTLTKAILIRSEAVDGAGTTIIDCEYISRCMTVTAGASGATLRGITLMQGGTVSPSSRASQPLNPSIVPEQSALNSTNRLLGLRRPTLQSWVGNGTSEESSLATTLANLSQEKAADVLSRWFLLSGATGLISALPAELVTHPRMLARVESGLMDRRPEDALFSRAQQPEPPKHGAHQHAASMEGDRDDECAPAPPDIPAGCSDETLLVASCGSLTEGSSQHYASNARCSWVIDPPEAQSLDITVTMLDIEADLDCRYDAMSLTDTDPNGNPRFVGSFCGDWATGEIYCTGDGCENINLRTLKLGSPLTIAFFSDRGYEQKGFELSWQASADPSPSSLQPIPPIFFGGCLFVKDAALSLEDVRIQDGHAVFGGGVAFVNASASILRSSFSGSSARFGGGVFANSSSLRILQSRVTYNRAQSHLCKTPDGIPLQTFGVGGGGLFVVSSKIAATVSVLTDNGVRSQCGSNQAAGGALCAVQSTVTLDATQMIRNSVQAMTAAHGGAVFLSGTNASVSSSSFLNNSIASYDFCSGAGVHAHRSRVSVLSSQIHGNMIELLRTANLLFSARGFGGGLFITASTTTMVASQVNHNSIAASGAWGGGIYLGPDISLIPTFQKLVMSFSNVSDNALTCDDFRSDPCHGGGIFSRRSTLLVTFSNFSHNSINASAEFHAKAGGGGIYFSGEALTIPFSTVCNNFLSAGGIATAADSFGGGIFFAGTSLSILSSSLSNNVAVSQFAVYGGALYVEATQTTTNVTIASSHLTNNELVVLVPDRPDVRRGKCEGGGIWAGPNVRVSVRQSHVSYNVLTRGPGLVGDSGFGGGIHSIRGNVFMSQSHVNSNLIAGPQTPFVEVFGAGLFLLASSITLIECRVSNNTGTANFRADGGGIFSRRYDTGFGGRISLLFSNVTFNRLTANSTELSSSFGGGVYAEGIDDIFVRSCQLSHNHLESSAQVTTAFGGAIFAFPDSYSETVNITICFSELRENSLSTTGRGAGAGFYASVRLTGFSSFVTILSSTLNRNVVKAQIGQGGAIFLSFVAGLGDQNVMLVDVVAEDNLVLGSEVSGGGVHCESALLVMQMVEMTNNQCHGTSNSLGGAISARGGTIVMQQGRIARNAAASGGAVELAGVSASLSGLVMRNNSATGLGAAILVTGGATLFLQQALLLDNRALLADNIFAYGSGLSLHTGTNVSMFSAGVMSIFAQGRLGGILLARHDGSVVSSNNAGWACDVSATNSSEIIRFSRCVEGQYLLGESTSVNPLQCIACPTGAKCRGANDVGARRSYWGWVDESGTLKMVLCPAGYCCDASFCPQFDHCQGNRAGLLCGRCREGFSEVVGGPGCQYTGECNHFRWILPCLLVFSGLAVVGLVTYRHRKIQKWTKIAQRRLESSHGEVEVVVFFFQILPLTVSYETRQASSQFMNAVMAIFNLRWPSNGAGGVCPYADFSSLSKIISGAVVPIVCCLWLLVFSGVSWLLSRLPLDQGHEKQRTRSAALVGALFDLLQLSYSTLVQTTFQLLACVDLQGRSVLFRNAEIECYQPWQIAIMCLGIPLLLSFPGGLALLVRMEARHREHAHGCKSSLWLRSAVDAIANAYNNKSPHTHQWSALLLLERLLAISVSVFVAAPVWRAWGLVVVILCALVLQLLVRPFKRRSSNLFMAFALFVLNLIAAWEVAVAVYVDGAIDMPGDMTDRFLKITLTITIVPVIVGVLMAAKSRLPSRWRQWFSEARGRLSGSHIELGVVDSSDNFHGTWEEDVHATSSMNCPVCKEDGITEPASLSEYCCHHQTTVC